MERSVFNSVRWQTSEINLRKYKNNKHERKGSGKSIH
jgi:hypothetical protein